MMRIKYARRGLAWPVILVALPISRATAEQASAPPQKISTTKKAVDPFLTGPPFTFEQMLRLVHQNTISLRRRKHAIQRRGLAFLLTGEGTAKLKAAGAPLELLDAIKSKAISASASCPIAVPPPPTPPSPPPPKRPPAGKLAIRCAPAECQINLNETPRGSTHDGLLELAEMPVGQSKITFKKDGYLDRSAVVTVEPDETVSISEILSPNRA